MLADQLLAIVRDGPSLCDTSSDGVGCPRCDEIENATATVHVLADVVEEARNVLEAYDNAERESDWTGAMVDTRLRAALKRLEATP